jgi:hypothetical protein
VTKYLENYAVISDCGRYRYLLRRTWDYKKPRALICMLNPSTADAKQDDATIRSCVRLLSSIGYGSFEVVNVFAHRATDPKELGHMRHVAIREITVPSVAFDILRMTIKIPALIAGYVEGVRGVESEQTDKIPISVHVAARGRSTLKMATESLLTARRQHPEFSLVWEKVVRLRSRDDKASAETVVSIGVVDEDIAASFVSRTVWRYEYRWCITN